MQHNKYPLHPAVSWTDVVNAPPDNVWDKSPQLSIKNVLPVTDEARLGGVSSAAIFWSIQQGCGRQQRNESFIE